MRIGRILSAEGIKANTTNRFHSFVNGGKLTFVLWRRRSSHRRKCGLFLTHTAWFWSQSIGLWNRNTSSSQPAQKNGKVGVVMLNKIDSARVSSKTGVCSVWARFLSFDYTSLYSTSLVFCSFESESPFTSSVTWVCDRVGTTQLAQKAPSQTYFQVHNSSLEICLNASIKAQKIKRSAFYTHRAIRLGGSIN